MTDCQDDFALGHRKTLGRHRDGVRIGRQVGEAVVPVRVRFYALAADQGIGSDFDPSLRDYAPGWVLHCSL